MSRNHSSSRDSSGGSFVGNRYTDRFQWFLFVLVAPLVFIWPIPHTISIRELILVVTTGLLGYLVARGRIVVELPRVLRLPAYLCAILTFWMIVVSVFLSNETAWCLSELQSQWGRSLLTLSIGYVVGAWALESERRKMLLLTVILATLFVHVFYLDIYGVVQYFRTGALPRRIHGLAAGLDRESLEVWLAGTFLLAEIVARMVSKRRSLPVNNIGLGILLAATLLGSYLADSRNGMIVLLSMMLLSGALYVLVTQQNRKRQIITLIAGAVILVPAIVTILVRTDHRWNTFFQTIPIAWDTKDNRSWLELDKPLPTLPNGNPVNDSNYKRIAWFKEGMILVAERPLGRGFGRQIFGHALTQKYGVKKTQTHPHSGLLTLAIGAGIPGVALWVAFCILLVRLGYRDFVRTAAYPATALVLVTCGFFIAMTLDSMMQDHMLQEFMFFVGLLAFLSTTSATPEKR